MKQLLGSGWRTACRHPLLIILFYLYHFIWGFFLYRIVKSVVVPVLQRYPGDWLNESDLRLYWLEFHFRLTKTDFIEPYLWLLGGLLLARMLLTPLLHAGLFYSFHAGCTGQRQHRSFRRGIRKFGKIFTLYYWLKILLAAVPLYWLVPSWLAALQAHYEIAPYIKSIGISLAAYIFYLIGLKMLFMYNQFRLLTETELLRGILVISPSLHRTAGAGVGIFGAVIAVGFIYSLVSWLWAGLLAVILYQAFHFIRVLLRFWEIGCHYEIWRKAVNE